MRNITKEEHRTTEDCSTRVCICVFVPSHHADSNSLYPEATRYTNPLKRKFRAQRLAAESEAPLLTLISLVLMATF